MGKARTHAVAKSAQKPRFFRVEGKGWRVSLDTFVPGSLHFKFGGLFGSKPQEVLDELHEADYTIKVPVDVRFCLPVLSFLY